MFGELFRLRETKSLLAQLDDYEGCGPSAPQPTLYIRTIRPISRAGQADVDSWVYLYNRPVTGRERILSGPVPCAVVFRGLPYWHPANQLVNLLREWPDGPSALWTAVDNGRFARLGGSRLYP